MGSESRSAEVPGRLLCLVPLAVALHNLEEAVLMRGLLPLDPARLPEPLRGIVPHVTYPRFAVALLVVTVIPFAIAVAGHLRRSGGATVFLLLATQAVLLLNVLSHIGSAILLRGYSPGLVTALLVNLPVSVYLFRRAAREHWLSRRALRALPIVAVLVHGPGIVALFALAAWLMPGP